ncbi:MAG: acetyl-CoA carboxylase biotin carboxyl carrier protein subunit [Gemmatimonadota bacterium]|nr:MAG: acetyl-CoA carboxylase biotin carboxyl carrier protein subunit [Gemmatimonadota bacterium]
MEYEFGVSGKQYKIDVRSDGENYTIDFGDGPVPVDARPISENCLSLLVEGRSYKVSIAASEQKRYLHIDGYHFCLEEVEETARSGYVRGGSVASGEQSLAAPMPGTVVKIQVTEGDHVEKNQSLIIVESMKMENALRSPIDGRVKKIHYNDGDLVDAGVPLVEIAPLEGSAD